ncbi:hypothetical protein ACE1SV_34610 [Streptomyces sp. E-15]
MRPPAEGADPWCGGRAAGRTANTRAVRRAEGRASRRAEGRARTAYGHRSAGSTSAQAPSATRQVRRRTGPDTVASAR